MEKKKIISGVIVGLMVFGSIVGAATYFSAKDISFTPTDENWNVTNVEAAVESLYGNLKTGKELLASTITNKGVSTNSNDTFQTMAENIAKIKGEQNLDISTWYKVEIPISSHSGEEYRTVTLETEPEYFVLGLVNGSCSFVSYFFDSQSPLTISNGYITSATASGNILTYHFNHLYSGTIIFYYI